VGRQKDSDTIRSMRSMRSMRSIRTVFFGRAVRFAGQRPNTSTPISPPGVSQARFMPWLL
jgi:hypothetical protein